MRIAIEAAKFTSEEANGLRRAMATFRNVGTIGKFESKMVNNMIERGYDPEQFAKNCFEQIKGFGSYGFPESHAASFAQLVYVSSWLKHFHPDAFCCGLLNSQPMGFYAPAQIVGDARKNGVEVREIDVSFSYSQNTLEEQSGDHHAVRLGFRQIDGFKWADPDEEFLRTENNKRLEIKKPKPEDWGERIVAARERRPFTSLEDFARDTGLPKRALILLADADAFRSIGLDRRAALWAVRRLPDDVPLPLFEIATAREQPDEDAQPLPLMPLPEQVVADYQTIRLSLKGHPMEFLRAMFAAERVVSCARSLACQRQTARPLRRRGAGAAASGQRQGRRVHDAGGRNRHRQYRGVAEGDGAFSQRGDGRAADPGRGNIQSSPEKVVHLVAERLFDRSARSDASGRRCAWRPACGAGGPALVEPLNDDRREHPDNPAQKIRHPRNVRILPRSRDFH